MYGKKPRSVQEACYLNLCTDSIHANPKHFHRFPFSLAHSFFLFFFFFLLFSCLRSQLHHGGSSVAALRLIVACGLSCPSECGILVPGPGIKPVSSVLQGRFVTSGSSKKSPFILSLLEQRFGKNHCDLTLLLHFRLHTELFRESGILLRVLTWLQCGFREVELGISSHSS